MEAVSELSLEQLDFVPGKRGDIFLGGPVHLIEITLPNRAFQSGHKCHTKLCCYIDFPDTQLDGLTDHLVRRAGTAVKDQRRRS